MWVQPSRHHNDWSEGISLPALDFTAIIAISASGSVRPHPSIQVLQNNYQDINQDHYRGYNQTFLEGSREELQHLRFLKRMEIRLTLMG